MMLHSAYRSSRCLHILTRLSQPETRNLLPSAKRTLRQCRSCQCWYFWANSRRGLRCAAVNSEHRSDLLLLEPDSCNCLITNTDICSLLEITLKSSSRRSTITTCHVPEITTRMAGCRGHNVFGFTPYQGSVTRYRYHAPPSRPITIRLCDALRTEPV